MDKFEGLVLVTGMGDAEQNSTDEWVKLLYPEGVIESSGDRKWLRDGERTIYLFEVYYDDINQQFLDKYTGYADVLEQAGAASSFLETHGNDVFLNVLDPNVLNASQTRFVEQYKKAFDIVIDEEVPLSQVTLGVLSHSLGTFVAYESLYKVMDMNVFVAGYMNVNLVMCAPMLRPIFAVQYFLSDSHLLRDRYLIENGSQKPYKKMGPVRETLIENCVAIYNRKDPFYQIHSNKFYDNEKPNNDLVDELILYTHGDNNLQIANHSMEGSYIPENNASIRTALFGDHS